MDTSTLEQMGLSAVEAKTYLALLEIGSAVANKIAERSGIHRRTVYDALETLIEKGLVSHVIEANKRYYQAEQPNHFLTMLDNRKDAFLQILPALMLKRELAGSRQEVTVYRGKSGIKNIYEDILEEKKPVSLLGTGGRFRTLAGDAYADSWHARAKKKRIKIQAIYSETARTQSYHEPNQDSKFLPNTYNIPASFTVYGDNVLITLFSDQPFGILIRSNDIRAAFKRYFDVLWKIAKK